MSAGQLIFSCFVSGSFGLCQAILSLSSSCFIMSRCVSFSPRGGRPGGQEKLGGQKSLQQAHSTEGGFSRIEQSVVDLLQIHPMEHPIHNDGIPPILDIQLCEAALLQKPLSLVQGGGHPHAHAEEILARAAKALFDICFLRNTSSIRLAMSRS